MTRSRSQADVRGRAAGIHQADRLARPLHATARRDASNQERQDDVSHRDPRRVGQRIQARPPQASRVEMTTEVPARCEPSSSPGWRSTSAISSVGDAFIARHHPAGGVLIAPDQLDGFVVVHPACTVQRRGGQTGHHPRDPSTTTSLLALGPRSPAPRTPRRRRRDGPLRNGCEAGDGSAVHRLTARLPRRTRCHSRTLTLPTDNRARHKPWRQLSGVSPPDVYVSQGSGVTRAPPSTPGRRGNSGL